MNTAFGAAKSKVSEAMTTKTEGAAVDGADKPAAAAASNGSGEAKKE